MSLKLFIFDCDGTIVDSAHTIVEGMDKAYQRHDLTPPGAAATRSIIGLSLPEAIEHLSPGIDAVSRDLLVQSYKDHVTVKRENGEATEHLYDGAKEVIEALAVEEEILLGIATGKAYRGVLHLFNTFGWHDHFVTVQTSDRAPSKPNPGMILQAMEETGIAASDTVMIGDTSYDMEMAISAGVQAVGVTWGYHLGSDLTAAGAHHLVDDYAGLDRLLRSL